MSIVDFSDNAIVGYRRQLPGQIAIDASFIHRDDRDRTTLVDENVQLPRSGQLRVHLAF